MNNTFVFDTNALISAHLLPKSVSRSALDKATKTGILVYSEETLREFHRVFSYPKFDKYHALSSRLKMVKLFEDRNQLITITERLKISRDASDDMFLEVALSAEADCIISGDPHLLELNPFCGIPILSPADFLKAF